jgi:hypothetical protein
MYCPHRLPSGDRVRVPTVTKHGPTLTRLLPETDVARVRRWVADRNSRIPERARDEIRYELDVDDRAVTVYECRPLWRPEYGPEWTRFPIVRFRYTKARREWTTYWRDRHLKFHRFPPIDPSEQIEVLLTAVDADRTGIFWG